MDSKEMIIERLRTLSFRKYPLYLTDKPKIIERKEKLRQQYFDRNALHFENFSIEQLNFHMKDMEDKLVVVHTVGGGCGCK